MAMSKGELDISLIGRGLAILLFVFSFRQQPYEYYIVLRCAVAASAAYCCYLAGKKDFMGWAVWFFVLAGLYNPFIPFRLNRETWQIIDIVAAVFLAASMPCVRWNTLATRAQSVSTYIDAYLLGIFFGIWSGVFLFLVTTIGLTLIGGLSGLLGATELKLAIDDALTRYRNVAIIALSIVSTFLCVRQFLGERRVG
jgi:hypothetical protein